MLFCVSESYTVRFYDGVVRTVKPAKVKPFQRVRDAALPSVLNGRRSSGFEFLSPFVFQKPRAERNAVGSEGWEEGESEEDGEVKGKGSGEEEEQTKGDEGAQEKMAFEGTDEAEGGKRKQDTPPPYSDPPPKKKPDDGKSADV